MIQKKITVSLLASAMIMAAGAMTSFAAPAVPLCNVEGCSLSAEHYHDGVCYGGHSADDGHAYHENCNVENCTNRESHSHDGVCYGGHRAGDGHGGCAGRSTGRSGGGHHRSGGHCR